MINKKTLSEHRAKDLDRLYALLANLPLSYSGYRRLLPLIKTYPAEALLMGRHLQSTDYRHLVRPWVQKAIEQSPHLNN